MNLVKDIYLEFFKNHKQFYFLFLLNVISTPLKQVGIPHFYGKIIECLKKPDIQGATKMLFILLKREWLYRQMKSSVLMEIF